MLIACAAGAHYHAHCVSYHYKKRFFQHVYTHHDCHQLQACRRGYLRASGIFLARPLPRRLIRGISVSRLSARQLFGNIGNFARWMIIVRMPVESAALRLVHQAAAAWAVEGGRCILIRCHLNPLSHSYARHSSNSSLISDYITLHTPQISHIATPISPKVLLRVFQQS